MSVSAESSLGERPRALVVDDDVILRRVVRSALVRAGFDVAQVGSGTDALRLIAAYELDLVITDLQMPGMGGLELLSELRQRRVLCPVIVMSGSPDARAESILAAGALAFLPKPFGVEELVSAAQAAVARPRTLPPSSAILVRHAR